jgi:hypothetical protein
MEATLLSKCLFALLLIAGIQRFSPNCSEVKCCAKWDKNNRCVKYERCVIAAPEGVGHAEDH